MTSATDEAAVAVRRGLVHAPLPSARRLTANFLLLTGGEVVAKGLTFAGFVYLGRVLGPESYGRLEFVLATMVFFTLPVDFGLGTYGAREIARDPGRVSFLLRDITTLRLLLAGASFAVLLLVVVLIPQGPDVKLLLALYGLSLFAIPGMLHWVSQGHDQMQWVAVGSLVRQTIFVGLLFLWLRPGTPLPYLGLFECLSVVAVAVLCAWVWRRPLRRAWRLPRPEAGQLGVHFRLAAPIGLSELAWAFLWYFATVLLGLLVGGDSLGWFGASHRMVMALHTFVWLYFFNLLPSIVRCLALPKEHLQRLLGGSLHATLWAGFFAALVLTLFAGDLLTLAYGPDFTAAARPFAVLVWMIPVALLSGHYRYTLIACNQQRLECLCTVVAALTAAILGLILIPRHGAVGAAAALLIAKVVNLGLAMWFVRQRIVAISCRGTLAAPLGALAIAAAIFLVLRAFSPVLGISAAILAYGLCCAAAHVLVGRRLGRSGPGTEDEAAGMERSIG